MDRDTIIRLAKDAGLPTAWISDSGVLTWTDLEHFATLVAAHEREECAQVCEELELRSADGQLGTYIAGWSDGTDDCAAAIRSRT